MAICLQYISEYDIGLLYIIHITVFTNILGHCVLRFMKSKELWCVQDIKDVIYTVPENSSNKDSIQHTEPYFEIHTSCFNICYLNTRPQWKVFSHKGVYILNLKTSQEMDLEPFSSRQPWRCILLLTTMAWNHAKCDYALSLIHI